MKMHDTYKITICYYIIYDIRSQISKHMKHLEDVLHRICQEICIGAQEGIATDS